MLVSESYLKETLPKSFIFYQPKDVISGDFYWAHKDESNIFLQSVIVQDMESWSTNEYDRNDSSK